MFFVFSFFHFLCKFRISTSPLLVTKNKISTNFQNNFLVTLAKLGPLSKSMQIFLFNIMSEPSQSLSFTYFCTFIFTFFLFWPSLKHKCCLRREAILINMIGKRGRKQKVNVKALWMNCIMNELYIYMTQTNIHHALWHFKLLVTWLNAERQRKTERDRVEKE